MYMDDRLAVSHNSGISSLASIVVCASWTSLRSSPSGTDIGSGWGLLGSSTDYRLLAPCDISDICAYIRGRVSACVLAICSPFHLLSRVWSIIPHIVGVVKLKSTIGGLEHGNLDS